MIPVDIDEPRLTPEQRAHWAEKATVGYETMRSWRDMCEGTCLIVGNGQSQHDIPVKWMNRHTSFGMNYCHQRAGFNPTYFIVGDCSVGVHEWEKAYERHKDIPMFLPSPGMDSFGTRRDNVARYIRVHRHGQPVGPESDPTKGIAFTSVAHAATIIAVYMGFTKLLYVGLDGDDHTQHFYGKGYPEDYNRLGNAAIVGAWDKGFAMLRDRFKGVMMVNLSTETTLTSLPRDEWSNY